MAAGSNALLNVLVGRDSGTVRIPLALDPGAGFDGSQFTLHPKVPEDPSASVPTAPCKKASSNLVFFATSMDTKKQLKDV